MLKYLLKYKDSTGEADEIFYPTRETVEKEIIAQMEEVRSSLFSGICCLRIISSSHVLQGRHEYHPRHIPSLPVHRYECLCHLHH